MQGGNINQSIQSINRVFPIASSNWKNSFKADWTIIFARIADPIDGKNAFLINFISQSQK